MSYTTIPHLSTTDPSSGEIQRGSGFFKPGYTFFYWEDIQMVINQSPNALISNLQFANVLFEKNDGENHGQHEVSVLALRKTPNEIAAMGGSFNNEVEGRSRWHNIVALPWPVYYRKATTELVDVDNPAFDGERFEGSDSYIPGQILPS